MNKTAIKNFAVWARKKLISEITYKAGLIGITEKDISKPLDMSTNNVQFFDIGTNKPSEISNGEIKQRDALVSRIHEKEKGSDYKTAFQFVIEEVAYTWFNRLVAIRFMEVNDYLPSRVRVLSSEAAGKAEPDMVTTPFETDMEFSAYEKDRVLQLKDENKLDVLFRMLFIKQCNKLNEVLPELFEKTSDYTELLLTISFTDADGVVAHLVKDIDGKDFDVTTEDETGNVNGQVEIIGWLYQYYNTEPKDEVFALLKKNVKITKERIPAATQLFTPDWIVRYMVENSLGRLWLEQLESQKTFSFSHIDFNNFSFGGGESHESSGKQKSLKENWKYYLDEAEQEESVKAELEKIRVEYKKIKLEEIKLIDPCMGSGHILVYAFDVLMQIYESQGYTQRDAAASILENNIYGLDIDERAYQLTYFALMMMAMKYDRRFLTRKIAPQVYCPKNYADGQEFGSLLNVDTLEPQPQEPEEFTLYNTNWEGDLNTWNFRRLLNQKYDVVITNPPYMGASGMSAKLSDFVKANYPDSKSDLFAVFIEKGNSMIVNNGYNCMVTMQSWMFLSSFEKMRTNIINTKTISNLMHMENMVMGIAFGTAVTNFRNANLKSYKGTYNHITMKDIGNDDAPIEFPVMSNRFAQVSTENFSKIPGSPIAYWVSEKMIAVFTASQMFMGNTKKGILTGEDKTYVRLWFEVSTSKTGMNLEDYDSMIKSVKKWFPVTSGGLKRKWYGNLDTVVNLENDGADIKANVKNFRLREPSFYMKEALTWTEVSSGIFSCRFVPQGILFGNGGPVCFFTNDSILYHLGLLNSKICMSVLECLAPTINYGPEQISKIPLIMKSKDIVENIANENIAISKTDWDSFETSWDFKKHPLLNGKTIKDAFSQWSITSELNFNILKSNEEELNRIFIDIYGLQDELTPEVADKDVTVRKADLTRDIKSFVSYAVGCMLGRYSLDVDGLAYAGGEWDSEKYKRFIPDKDNCIPITDEEYFEDDIVGLFVAFVKQVYGEETLDENLEFIANALGNKGDSPKEIIRNYFIKDFYKDHVKIYQKRPIYWLYDSGKQDGFKALVYMHRYDADTTGRVRMDYLHRMQKVYQSEIESMNNNIQNNFDVAKSQKRLEKLVKQLKETKEYDEKIAHLALSRIAIDLDDGVVKNYEKVQTSQDGKKLEILGKI